MSDGAGAERVRRARADLYRQPAGRISAAVTTAGQARLPA